MFRYYHIPFGFKKVMRLSAIAGALIIGCSLISAETVSQKEAKRIASTFFNAAYGQKMADPTLVYNGRKLTTGSYFAPFYVYNLPVGGFVVISAENKAYPILGYSLTDNFSPDKMGQNLKALLTLYARHIENIRYDSSVPYQAMESWQNIPEYISTLLDAPYSATDPETLLSDALEAIEYVAAGDNAAVSASATYSPDQWNGLIDNELQIKKDVPIGIVNGDSLTPAVVYGRKGDMFRILLDERDKSLWRLLPTENISSGQIAVLGNPPAIPSVEEEEIPFSFYDDFIATVQSEEKSRRAAIEQSVIPEDPVVLWHGSGHFSVTLPEEVKSMRVYSLDGQLVQRDTFRETYTANVELTRNPTGFYFAVFFGESGKPYPVKLFR